MWKVPYEALSLFLSLSCSDIYENGLLKHKPIFVFKVQALGPRVEKSCLHPALSSSPSRATQTEKERQGELQEGRCRALAGEEKQGRRERGKNVYMTAESRRTTSSIYGSFSLIGGSFRFGVPCQDFHCQIY